MTRSSTSPKVQFSQEHAIKDYWLKASIKYRSAIRWKFLFDVSLKKLQI